METVCNKLEKSMMEVKVTFTTEEWKDAQKKALKKLAKNVKIDGFRKGTAPIQLVKARVGKATILNEALDNILQDNYATILTDNGINPVGQPEVKIDEFTTEILKLTVVAPVKPDVELGQYKELEVKKSQVKVTQKEIDEELKNYQNQFAELIVKEEGTVEQGDTAVIDYDGFKDGVAFEGGQAENYPLEIGSGSFIPGFEDQIVGMAIDEEKEINVTFPEDYHVKELAGQLVVFKVKLHEIKSKVLPEIDDELAKDLNIDGIETLDDLRTYIKEQIKNRKQTEADNKFNMDLMDAVIENSPVEVPDAMVDAQVQDMMQDVERNLGQQGISLELFQQLSGKTTDDMKSELRADAQKRVQFNLIIAKVAEVENLEVTDEEIDEEMKEIANYYNREFDEVKKLFEGQVGQIKADLLSRKAVQFIKDNLK